MDAPEEHIKRWKRIVHWKRRRVYSQRPALPRIKKLKSGGHKWVPVEGVYSVFECPCGVVYRPQHSPNNTTRRRWYTSITARRAMLNEPRCQRR